MDEKNVPRDLRLSRYHPRPGWAKRTPSGKVVASNRRARHDYEILDTFEAGIALLGPEVKSLRNGKANLTDGYAVIRRGEVFLANVHIGPYEQASRENAEPRRERKLLLHRAEIARLAGKVAERGLTLIPLRLYFKQRPRQGRARPVPREAPLRQARVHPASARRNATCSGRCGGGARSRA